MEYKCFEKKSCEQDGAETLNERSRLREHETNLDFTFQIPRFVVFARVYYWWIFNGRSEHVSLHKICRYKSLTFTPASTSVAFEIWLWTNAWSQKLQLYISLSRTRHFKLAILFFKYNTTKGKTSKKFRKYFRQRQSSWVAICEYFRTMNFSKYWPLSISTDFDVKMYERSVNCI